MFAYMLLSEAAKPAGAGGGAGGAVLAFAAAICGVSAVASNAATIRVAFLSGIGQRLT
jgi:hypothetical protein